MIENYLKPKEEVIIKNKVKSIKIYEYDRDGRILNYGNPVRFYSFNRQSEPIKELIYEIDYDKNEIENFFKYITITNYDKKRNAISEFYQDCKGLEGECPVVFKSKIFRIDDKNDKLIEYSEIDSNHKTLKHEYFRYIKDTNNDELYLVTNTKKKLIKKIHTKYEKNARGEKIKKLYYNRYGFLTGLLIRQYDKFNNRLSESDVNILEMDNPIKRYNYGLYGSKTEYEYDKNNNRTVRRFYDKEENCIGERKYKYDKKNRLIEESRFDSADNNYLIERFNYVKTGLLIQKSATDTSGNFITNYFSRYFKNSQLIECILDDEQSLKYKFEYEYYNE